MSSGSCWKNSCLSKISIIWKRKYWEVFACWYIHWHISCGTQHSVSTEHIFSGINAINFNQALPKVPFVRDDIALITLLLCRNTNVSPLSLPFIAGKLAFTPQLVERDSSPFPWEELKWLSCPKYWTSVWYSGQSLGLGKQGLKSPLCQEGYWVIMGQLLSD